MPNPAHFIKYKIGVSGAAETAHCFPNALERTEELGRLIASRGMILVTGATTGAPAWAAKGAKEAGGFVLGISPAISEYHHINDYHLPTDYHDIIIYTGFGYAGRNLYVTRAADALITVCGRMGTLNEFSAAFEDGKVQGVLTGTGGTSELLPQIIENAHRGGRRVVFDSDVKRLLNKIVELLDEGRGKPVTNERFAP